MSVTNRRFKGFAVRASSLCIVLAALIAGCGGGGGGGSSVPPTVLTPTPASTASSHPTPSGAPTPVRSGSPAPTPSASTKPQSPGPTTTPTPASPSPTTTPKPPTPTPTVAPTATPTAVAFNTWPTYGYDNAHDGFNPNTQLFTAASIPALHLGWQISLNEVGTQTQPILATNIGSHKGMLFVGGRSGVEYGIDALTGAQVWNRSFGQEQMQCFNGPLAILGLQATAVYDPVANVVYVEDGTNSGPNAPVTVTVYKLDPATGNTLGSVNVTPGNLQGEVDFSHTGLTLASGSLYIGTGSTCDASSWRGRLAAVNVGSMTLGNTFFPAYNRPGPYSGGGVWGWGGAAVDPAGNVYIGAGNAQDSSGPGGPQPPFQPATSEQAGYAEHLVQLTGDLSTVLQSHAIPYAFNNQAKDLDLSGTPVLFTPLRCPQLVAIQGKAGQLNIYNTAGINNGPLASFTFSEMVGDVSYIGNGTYSPLTGLYYANVPTSQGGSIRPPGMVAIGVTSCATPSIVWSAQFGADSYGIGSHSGQPRSAPTVTAGNVVFVATPTAQGTSQLWALDATTGVLLNGAQPILTTSNLMRMPPVIDGKWMYVLDQGGNLYGLTVDPGVPGIRTRFRQSAMPASMTW